MRHQPFVGRRDDAHAVSDPLVPLDVRYGRRACGDLTTAEHLEWLVTNGLGGYASGTVAGLRTRRYHGLLVAALDPPASRTVMVTDLLETLVVPSGPTALHASRWRDDVVVPRGFDALEAFWLEGRTPVWRYTSGDAVVEKRIGMIPGRNATVVRYRLVRGLEPVALAVRILATYRDFHATVVAGAWRMRVDDRDGEIVVEPFDGARPLRISVDGMDLSPQHEWYYGFALARERDRGLDHLDDALHVATATVDLAIGQEVSLTLAADDETMTTAEAVALGDRRDAVAIELFGHRQEGAADEVGARLALAADDFIVRRDVDGQDGASVIAGYPWFGDWGRDTMIALPGLLLATGRASKARTVLSTYARCVDRGMLPNRFPDTGHAPEYNTADATLWFVEAVRAYVAETDDATLVQELFPVLEDVVGHHDRGTRHGIGVDPHDGLLRAGEPGVQVTWMDAKVGDWVVTPRIGKCVEINALWYNALVAMGDLAARSGSTRARWDMRAAQVRAGFERFWSDADGYLYDVIDGPGGDDRALRPNQIFTVSLAASPLTSERQRAVVAACGRSLVTSHGLRSLGASHPDYRGRYGRDQVTRDGAYHQGTVWAWLLGPFALAHYRAWGDARLALSYLKPLVDHLSAAGIGSVSEIFDGDPPFRPDGCTAQAWSVAELLRAWTVLRCAMNSSAPTGSEQARSQ